MGLAIGLIENLARFSHPRLENRQQSTVFAFAKNGPRSSNHSNATGSRPLLSPEPRARRNHLHTDSRRKILVQDSGRDLTLKPRSRDMTRPGAREGAPGSVLTDGGGED